MICSAPKNITPFSYSNIIFADCKYMYYSFEHNLNPSKLFNLFAQILIKYINLQILTDSKLEMILFNLIKHLKLLYFWFIVYFDEF